MNPARAYRGAQPVAAVPLGSTPRRALNRRYPVLALTLAAAMACLACDRNAAADPAAAPGEPIASLTEAELGRFLLGKAVFERLVVPDEGLGPLFNAERCSACHDVPATGGSGNLLVTKATRFENGSCSLLEAEGGDNIQQRATPALAAHGITHEAIPASATATAQVAAPPLFGLGLLEAIPDAAILGREDSLDADGDGISGRASRTTDGRIGRFGRKAEFATVSDFIEGALRFEIGLTTELHPTEEKPNGATLPPDVDPKADPEIDNHGLGRLNDYVSMLAPPARQHTTGAIAAEHARGEELFTRIGCAGCHTPTVRTGPNPSAARRNRTLRLYSDLLLHDLGPALADVCGTHAAPAEWRTPALWGLRYRTRLMHDGRDTTIVAAILSHDGEGKRSRDAFDALPPAQRQMVVRFLGTL